MKLSEVLAGVPVTRHQIQDVEITGVCYDTRTMIPGCLFVALPGYKTNGHKFIQQALDRGAAAVLCRRPPAGEGRWLTTDDPRAALAAVSANWFGHPAGELTVLAVTGTNGKTTTTYLLKAMLEGVLGAKVGLIGTNQNLIGVESLPAHRTTPESWEVQKLLREMADAGCSHVVMEASSHALALRRLDGIRFAAGIFTNLTQDHLDFHKTMEAYRDAKGLLFRQCETAVLNLDDETGRYYASNAPCPVFTYSERRDEADLTAKNLRLFPQRVEFEAVTMDAIARVRLAIPGGFTVYNALGVLSCGVVLGLPLADCAGALATAGYGTALGVIRGALEAGKKVRVIADETRPFLQGARLTAWELQQDGIDVRVACDNACALLMQKGLVQCVVVGADRIAANGDAANKIGTFGVALLAKHFGIPFYVAAPLSTIDPRTPDGAHIPIEERPDREVTHVGETRIVPEGVPVFNFAFDVTPADCITGIITEKGVLRAPYGPAIAAALKA